MQARQRAVAASASSFLARSTVHLPPILNLGQLMLRAVAPPLIFNFNGVIGRHG